MTIAGIPGTAFQGSRMRMLEVMRQPMEDKVVTISRPKGTLTF